jgi:hypothetical protein
LFPREFSLLVFSSLNVITDIFEMVSRKKWRGCVTLATENWLSKFTAGVKEICGDRMHWIDSRSAGHCAKRRAVEGHRTPGRFATIKPIEPARINLGGHAARDLASRRKIL